MPAKQPLGKQQLLPTVDYNQGLDPKWKKFQISSGGACLGLSVFWTAQTTMEKKFLIDLLEEQRKKWQHIH
jgi:hypothetical protein